MTHSLLLEGPRLQLLNQLVYFEDHRARFLDEHYPEQGQARSLVEKTLRIYASVLEDILEGVTFPDLHAIALIGSEIEIRYLDDGSRETYALVLPHAADPDIGRLSFLSPLGFQLLMARRGETYELDLPAGVVRVRIEGVRFTQGGETA
ncbi:GreA/GreB family elongation factor [Paenibacillus antri]|uniref:GreA/GreB family elongation factor n=1 Tax=Paenibacillus antri TaxID=2582848 RepID=A0A5R9FXE8_9BACL|nr:GreA/GreB family elongation factor [Paenibacillus antri]TLS48702.1 GreA/GreB family elongation factor [Paenibacillus antri]